MPYVTMMQAPIYYQISFDDILAGEIDTSKMFVPNATNTRTHFRHSLSEAFLSRYNFNAMLLTLRKFNEKYEHLWGVERHSLYRTFTIPKKSGGKREINAPLPELMGALRELKNIMETELFSMYHTSAFAYVHGRNTVAAMRRHQSNESHWFASLDFSNFFGNTTLDFTMRMLENIFPFSEIVKLPDGREVLEHTLDLCFLDGGLPQGTPISPMLTNLIMIPIDHQICNDLRKTKSHYVYTRYADDMKISSKYAFNAKEVEQYICEVLKRFGAPFPINDKKTHYGSSAGSNWNFGIMLNKDNRLTIGHENAKKFKATLHAYIVDRRGHAVWSLHDVQVLSGKIAYYRMIDREYIDYILDHYSEKFRIDLREAIKEDLRHRP